TGIHGGARLPDGPTAERIVTAFAAGPAGAGAGGAGAGAGVPGESTAHAAAAPGFRLNRRALAALVPGAAAVVLGRDEGVVLGPWPGGAEAPASIASLLQTPDPLVGGGAAVIPLEAAGVRRERSALCVLPSGHVVYAE